MPPKTILFWLLGLSLVLGACHKSSSAPSGPAVYAAGYWGNLRYNVAAYWANGRLISLTDTNHSADAYAITLDGNDVYVAGVFHDREDITTDKPVYWKNGQLTYLSTNYPGDAANAIAVVNGKVYVAGWDSGYHCYWVNGVRTRLKNAWAASELHSLAVQGNDVYIVGEDTLFHPCYLKNGVQTLLPGNYSIAQTIAISGTDIYIAGQTTDNTTGNRIAMLWKNGVPAPLSDGSTDVLVSSIVVDGGDVYVCGNIKLASSYGPIVYKNGQVLSSAAPASGTLYAWDIGIENGSVHVGGNQMVVPGQAVAATWSANGIVALDKDVSRASNVWGIYVKSK